MLLQVKNTALQNLNFIPAARSLQRLLVQDSWVSKSASEGASALTPLTCWFGLHLPLSAVATEKTRCGMLMTCLMSVGPDFQVHDSQKSSTHKLS